MKRQDERADIAIVHTPVGGGHRAAALAVAEAAERRGLRVAVFDTFDFGPKVFGDAYLAAHFTGQSAAPEFYGSAYERANSRHGFFEPIRRGFDQVALGSLVDAVARVNPSVVVATHHLPLVVLGRARRMGQLDAKLVGVVTDYTAHAVWAEKGVDGFAVGCDSARDELEAHGIRGETIERTGIPVRAAFDAVPTLREPAPNEPIRVLVTSGGFGIGATRAIVRSFRNVSDVLLTVVTGNGVRLRKEIARDISDLGAFARVLGFERDMAGRIAEAHVVVGKAGGLTVSETLASGRPMIVVGAVPGNEKRNEDLVTEGLAGFAAEPEDVAAIIGSMRKHREFASRGARARSLVPAGSAAAVLEYSLGLSGAGGGHAYRRSGFLPLSA